MATETTPHHAHEELRERVAGMHVAMLTTVAQDGSLHSRPMQPLEIDGSGELWFFTSMNSSAAEQIRADRHVNVSFVDPDHDHYVSVAGEAEVLQDRDRAETLWQPLQRAFFPEGIEDPDLALVRIVPESAQVWDRKTGRVLQVLNLVRAIATGKRYAPHESQRIDLR